MKLLKLRKKEAPRGQFEALATGGPTTRQLTALVVAFLLAVALSPVGAQAAQVVNAILTDPGGTNQATVDAGGNLHVAGEVTVDSSTPVTTTSADDPGRMAFQDNKGLLIEAGEANAFVDFDVPRGKRLVITHFSGTVALPVGQKVTLVALGAEAGGLATHRFVPTFTAQINGPFDAFAFSQDTVIYADGSFSVHVQRNDLPSSGFASVAVSGYLIDCSVAPCN